MSSESNSSGGSAAVSADPGAPSPVLKPSFARAVKGFILGVMVAAIVLPRIGTHVSPLSFYMGGGIPAAQLETTKSVSAFDSAKCAIHYEIPSGTEGVNSSIAGRAQGCPAEGLCRLRHVFDEIVVLTLPRRVRQWSRLQRQMAALEENYTVIHGFDIKTQVFQGLWGAMVRLGAQGKGYDTAGEFAVGLGWLSVLEHIVASGAQRALVLEDDVVFHSNFLVEFDRRIRKLPKDWRILYLGATQYNLWNVGDQVEWPEGVEDPEYYLPIYTWGAFSVGFSREVAINMLAEQKKIEGRIDTITLPVELRKQRGHAFAAYPHIAIADVRYSDLRTGGDIEPFAKECRWNLAMFDLDNGYTGDVLQRR